MFDLGVYRPFVFMDGIPLPAERPGVVVRARSWSMGPRVRTPPIIITVVAILPLHGVSGLIHLPRQLK